MITDGASKKSQLLNLDFGLKISKNFQKFCSKTDEKQQSLKHIRKTI